MILRPWVLSPSITAGFAIAFLLLVGSGGGVYEEQLQGARSVDEVERTLELLDQSEIVLARLVDAEAGQRGYLRTGAERSLKRYEDAAAALPRERAKLHELGDDSAEGRRHLERLDLLMEAELGELARLVELRRQRGPEAAHPLAAMDTGKAALDDIRGVVEDLRAAGRVDLELHRALRQAQRTRNRATAAGAIFFGAVLAGATLLALNRQTRRRLAAEAERDRSLRAEVALEERARVADALRASEEELRALVVVLEQARAQAERASERVGRLVEANVVGVMFGEGDAITEANDAALGIVGFARADLEAGPIPWREMTPPEFAALDERALAELARRGACAPYEKAFVRKDGTRVPILVGSASLGRSGADEWVCFVLDLTERDRALAAQRAALAEAEAANRAKDEFLAVLSHEMRSPLHALLGWLTILRQGLAQGKEVSRALETVQRNAELQAQLVNDLLDASRIVSDKLMIAREPVDLGSVVRTAVDNARPAAEARGVTITATVAELGSFVVGEEQRLVQVLGNLLANAVKFTPSGGRVTVTLANTAGEATLQVKDTGAGIAPEFLAHVFDRFRQADATTTRTHGGLGLGLYLVKTLVELHGGGIGVSSEGRGKGATFTVRLPLQAAVPALSLAPAPPIEEAHDELAGVSVVLVEDDPDSREALRLVLEHSGAEVHACASAAEARRVLERVRADVLVSDVGMPDETGYAFLRSVRARGGPHLPAVALTGFASRQDAEEAARAGFDEHLAKPVPAGTLVAKLRELARRSGPGAAGRPVSGTMSRTVRKSMVAGE